MMLLLECVVFTYMHLIIILIILLEVITIILMTILQPYIYYYDYAHTNQYTPRVSSKGGEQGKLPPLNFK